VYEPTIALNFQSHALGTLAITESTSTLFRCAVRGLCWANEYRESMRNGVAVSLSRWYMHYIGATELSWVGEDERVVWWVGKKLNKEAFTFCWWGACRWLLRIVVVGFLRVEISVVGEMVVEEMEIIQKNWKRHISQCIGGTASARWCEYGVNGWITKLHVSLYSVTGVSWRLSGQLYNGEDRGRKRRHRCLHHLRVSQ